MGFHESIPSFHFNQRLLYLPFRLLQVFYKLYTITFMIQLGTKYIQFSLKRTDKSHSSDSYPHSNAYMQKSRHIKSKNDKQIPNFATHNQLQLDLTIIGLSWLHDYHCHFDIICIER